MVYIITLLINFVKFNKKELSNSDNSFLYNINLYGIIEKLNSQTGTMQFYFYNLPRIERKSKEETNDYIMKHCEEVKDLINPK